MTFRWSVLPFAFVSLLYACGETETEGPEVPPDAPPSVQPCNPVTQAGCEVGEKCAELVEQVEPLLRKVACVPDGTVGEGEACSQGEAGASSGFDDCQAGLGCVNGACSTICGTAPDTCRVEGQGFGEGSYCTQFADYLSDDVGLCVPGCNPVEDDTCAEGFGCYLDSNRAVASCAGIPAPAQDLAQNSDCYGPATGGCFLNGCASGYTPILNNRPVGADASVCARYCEPANTYVGNDDDVEGAGENCSNTSLAQSGGTNGNNSPHQCRFLQSFYGNTDNMPVEIGLCVPVTSLEGGSWGDCSLLDWDGVKAAWNGAVEGGTDPNTALNAFCLTDPEDPQNSDILPRCEGLNRGCLSLEEQDTGLLDPAGGAFFSRQAWAESVGVEIPFLDATSLHEAM